MILPGSDSQALGVALAAETGRELAVVEYERFPDGELLAAAPDLASYEGEEVTVVATTTTSDAHIEVLQLQDAAREAGVDRVVTVVPYMGYIRRKDAFSSGEPVSTRAAARLVSTGADRVVLVNPYETVVSDYFDVPVEIADAGARLATPLPADLEDPLFLAPSADAVDLAATVRDAYGRGAINHFSKTRHAGDQVTVEPSDAAVDGRDVVVVDDIIATGTTMAESARALDGSDPKRLFASCVHPLLVGNARSKLAQVGFEGVFGTDTVEQDVSEVSVAPVVADVL
jgi:ribose-phosphate pyrophosphokinase